MTALTETMNRVIWAAIDAVKPDRLIREKIRLQGTALTVGDHRIDLSNYRHIYVVGMGKASAPMARELENILGPRLTAGRVVVKYGYGVPCRKVEILEAGHPVVDENGLKATRKIVALGEAATEEDLVFCLISGGGSALLELLPDGISLSDLQATFELLLSSGADIEEVNTVRKHLSLVKGGQLARVIAPATCVSLILSDVIGDPLESIASGPTAPDPTTFADAWQVIEKYGLPERLPTPVKDYLRQGVAGAIPETLKPNDALFQRVHNIILGNNREALAAARKVLEEQGYGTLVLTSQVQGEAREVAKVVAAIVKDIRQNNLPLSTPAGILMGGETTVTLKGRGKGGRNQELALAALLALKKVQTPFLIASVGTDGTDGPTDAAGGIASPDVLNKARELGLNPQTFLQNNDAYHFLDQTGGLIKTGPTGTNVMDIILAIIP